MSAQNRLAEIFYFSALPELPPMPVPASWGRPIVDLLDELIGAAESSLPGGELLTKLERMLADGILPALEKMDVDALADVLESAMGAAAVWGARESLMKAKVVGGRWEVGAEGGGCLRSKVKGLMSNDRFLSASLPGGIVIAPLAEAVAKLNQRTPVTAKLSSAQWQRVPLALRERAQFSARVDSVRFLAEVQEKIRKRLSLEREKLANGKEAFVDRSSFIADMRQIAKDENLDTTGDGRAAQRGSVRDIRSAKRLGLIFDQQTQQATEFARRKMDLDPDVLDAWPAQRFVRIEDRANPRQDWPERWKAAGSKVGWSGALQGQLVALKTSPIWAALSVFGVPWPPFDFGSGMGLEDVDRDEAEALGLLQPGEPMPEAPEDEFNQKLEASTSNFSLADVSKLQDQFGEQIDFDPSAQKVVWQGNKIARE